MEFDFVAIDFEIANSNLSSACSIGLVAVKDKAIVDTSYYLIKPPGLLFEKSKIDIHGITPADVKNSSLFPDVWEEIKHYFAGNTIIAHNAIFDMSVLKNCLLEYNIDIPNFSYICSISFSNYICTKQCIGTSLKNRASYFNIEMGNHHNALDDAKTCANIVIRTLDKLNCHLLDDYFGINKYLAIKHFYNLKVQREFKRNRSKFQV